MLPNNGFISTLQSPSRPLMQAVLGEYMANLGLRLQWIVRFCRLKKGYEISLEGVVQTRLE